MRYCSCLLGWLVILTAASAVAAAPAAPGESKLQRRLALAEKFVAASDKYLHHSKLRRGMTGYGLTVLEGVKIEKFNVTVVSVMRNWIGPRQDIVLCRLSGLGLAKTGIISGMSGSPIYIKDPADGKHKLIGALAYGWRYQKEPMTGIQPIVQMLAIQGVPLGDDAKKAPTARPAGKAVGAAVVDPDFVRAVLNPKKIDFTSLARPRRRRASGPAGATEPRLAPLSTPMMLSGASPATLTLARKLLAGADMVPLQAGGVGAAEAKAVAGVKFAPGASISIPIVTGDMDAAAVGTVTEVIGDHVLALGHSMDAEGVVEMPMATAYIHAPIASIYSSFKLGATLKITGGLFSDEYTGVVGQVGRKVKMIPCTVTVKRGDSVAKYNYRIVRHRWLTMLGAQMVLGQSVFANRDIPIRHTVEHIINIDFDKLGPYRAANISSGGGTYAASSDLSRPLVALANTTLGEPVFPKSIAITVTVRSEQTTADIIGVKLDRNSYKPGEKVTGKVTLRPFRAKRVTKDIAFELPADLPDGKYKLTVCGSYAAVTARESEMPHRFRAKTVAELYRAVQEVVADRSDRLYLRLPLPARGLAVDKQEIEHAPASMVELLKGAAPMDSSSYRRSKVVSIPVGMVVQGSVSAGFVVEKDPPRK